MKNIISFVIGICILMPLVGAQLRAAEQIEIPFQLGQGQLLYEEYCSSCHGIDLTGSDRGPPLLHHARDGKNGPGYGTLKSVWCAEDRNQAMTDARNNRFDGLPPGDCAQAEMIDHGYRAGNQVSIRGTPALIKSNGEKIEGYMPYLELIPQLVQ